MNQRQIEAELEENDDMPRISYRYDRLKAVQYAEKWWNSYNPAYKKFEVATVRIIFLNVFMQEAHRCVDIRIKAKAGG